MSIIPSDSDQKPHVEVDSQNYKLTEFDSAKIEDGLDPVRRVVRQFPRADLYITIIHHARSSDFHVKTSLILPGKTLFTGERGREMLPVFLRCVPKLVRKVEAYKSELSEDEDNRKHRDGTRHEIVPDQPVDMEAVGRAMNEGDYAAFRNETFMYEEPVALRAGRWVQRYPEANARIGKDLLLSDIVEEVFLNVFEHYDEMPNHRRLADWLEDWIDPSLRALIDHPDEELQNVDFARSYREAQEGQSG